MNNTIITGSFLLPLIKSRCLLFSTVTFFTILVYSGPCLGQKGETAPRVHENAFPVCTQFSPVPSGEGWKDENTPLTEELLRETIHDIIRHGFSLLSIHDFSNDPDEKVQTLNQLNYAQSQGMKVNYRSRGFELFNREHPSPVSVYSPSYAEEVQKRVQLRLAPLKEIDHLHSVFPFQDEPFHAGPESFDYSDEGRS